MNLARALTWPLNLAARLLQIPDDALDVWDEDERPDDVNDLDLLIDRLEGARDTLHTLAQRDGLSQPEFARLNGKREGVLLALSYAREMQR